MFRGSFQALRVNYTHTNGVLILWRKKDMSHAFLRLHPRDISQLIASQWSAIFGITMARYHLITTTTTYPNRTPSLPPRPDNDQQKNNNPETFDTPPSSPHPPDEPMPGDPHTPKPGYPPNDDDPFHTPFQSPPRPNDDSPDEDMHSPQDEPQIYHLIHHHHQIIHNHRFPEPMPYLSHQTR